MPTRPPGFASAATPVLAGDDPLFLKVFHDIFGDDLGLPNPPVATRHLRHEMDLSLSNLIDDARIGSSISGWTIDDRGSDAEPIA
jgi:hypothetical protein